VSMLRRLAVATYDRNAMLTLDQLNEIAQQRETDQSLECIQMRLDALLLPPWSAVESLPSIELPADLANRLLQGQRLGELFSERGLVRLFADQRFLGMAEVDDEGRLRARRLLDTSEN